MFAIKLSTGFAFCQVKELFNKLPGVVEFSHTNGPATNVLVKLPGYEDNRAMHSQWVKVFEPALKTHFGTFEVVEV